MKLTLAFCLMIVVLPGMLLAQSCKDCGKCPNAQAAAAQPASEHCHWLEVKSVVPGGPAEAAGIKAGDVIVKYDGQTVGCRADLNRAKESAKAESVSVVVRRGDRELSFLVPKGSIGAFLNEWQNDIVPDKDARIIKGVSALGWETGKMNSFMAAFEAVLQQQGATGDYAFLCGASGAAFRVHFFDTWCPSSPDPTCGYDATADALAACGYSATTLAVATDGKNWPQVVKEVKASIDAGMPVLAIDLIEVPEWGVITGYQKDGQELFCRTYFDKRKSYDLAQKLPMAVMILKKDSKAPDAQASSRKSFGIVAGNLAAQKYDQYYSGLAAFDKWIARLRTDDFKAMDSTKLSNAVQANNWIFSRLIADRKTGMVYLDRIAGDFPDLEPRVADLTALYLQEANLLEPLLAELPCPGGVVKGEQWTKEMKDKQIVALTTARGLEMQALAIWQGLAAKK
jgi:hypothetical protein